MNCKIQFSTDFYEFSWSECLKSSIISLVWNKIDSGSECSGKNRWQTAKHAHRKKEKGKFDACWAKGDN